ncbi:MAG: hypothetical protein WDM70_05210 [Nitrosomonadales bacterium]
MLAPASEGSHLFTLAEHLRPRFMPTSNETAVPKQPVTTPATAGKPTEQVTVQVVAEATEQVSPLVQLSASNGLLSSTPIPRARSTNSLAITGYKQRPYFKAHHLEPLLTGGVLRMTVPDKPRSSRQQYVLTEVGVKIKTMHGQAGEVTKQESAQ